MKRTIYMMVTRDKYQLPVVIADSVAELARKTGKQTKSIRSAMWNAKVRDTECSYVAVEIED